MDAIWKSDEFSGGGLQALKSFSGRLVNVEEDVEGRFSIQKRFDWQDVEIIEVTEPLTIKDGNVSTWMKQSGSKSSVDAKVVVKLEDFCKENKIEGSLPACLYDLNIVWERFIVEFEGIGDDGTAMQPGYAYAPISLVGKSEKKTATRGRRAAPPANEETSSGEEQESEEPESTEEAVEVPELVSANVLKTLGDDGATRDMVVRELKKTAPLRKALAAVEGGIDAVLSAMEGSGAIGADGDFYFPQTADEENAGF